MEIINQSSIWIYILIFLGKNLEVSISTIRIMLINRGERIKGSIIALIEVSLWLLITGTVLVGIKEDIFRSIVFVLAFATGNYLGSLIEAKLAFGLCSIQVIVPSSVLADKLVQILRDHSFAVTVIKGQGKDKQRDLLLLHLKRKRIPNAVRLVNDNHDGAMITVQDTRVVRGGFIKR